MRTYGPRDWIRFAVLVLLIGISTASAVAGVRASRDSQRTAKALEDYLRERAAETDRRRALEDKELVEEKNRDARDAALLAELKRNAETTAAVLAAVESCTTPTGDCARQNAQRTAEAIQTLQRQHDQQLEVIRALEFRVSGVVVREGGQAASFEGTARPAPNPAPSACVRVGNVGVLPGVVECEQP